LRAEYLGKTKSNTNSKEGEKPESTAKSNGNTASTTHGTPGQAKGTKGH
jgi:hypothetical protein